MIRLEAYAEKYKTVKMTRRNGILELRLHTDDKELRWGLEPHEELPDVFYHVGQDRENKVIILTGTGTEFSGPRPSSDSRAFPTRPEAQTWDKIYWEGKQLLIS